LIAYFKGELESDKSMILYQIRIPKLLTAILAGMSLSVCGVIMQTLFQNPLAGPYVLGINSGANLSVALIMLSTGSFIDFNNAFLSFISIQGAAVFGAFIMLLLMLAISKKFNQQAGLLLVGVMIAQMISAFQSLLEFFANADQLKSFLIWNLASLGNTNLNDIPILLTASFIGCGLALLLSRKMDILLLGSNYSTAMGINVKQLRVLIILITGILAGITTAYCGPIAFIGIAIPHISRLLFKTSLHKIIIPASMLIGAILLLLCDIICQLPDKGIILPLNVVTSIIGTPVIIYLLFKSSKNQFA
jgi:iron complex transport system permease protein